MLENIYYSIENMCIDIKENKSILRYLKEKSLTSIFRILMVLILDIILINIIYSFIAFLCQNSFNHLVWNNIINIYFNKISNGVFILLLFVSYIIIYLKYLKQKKNILLIIILPVILIGFIAALIRLLPEYWLTDLFKMDYFEAWNFNFVIYIATWIGIASVLLSFILLAIKRNIIEEELTELMKKGLLVYVISPAFLILISNYTICLVKYFLITAIISIIFGRSMYKTHKEIYLYRNRPSFDDKVINTTESLMKKLEKASQKIAKQSYNLEDKYFITNEKQIKKLYLKKSLRFLIAIPIVLILGFPLLTGVIVTLITMIIYNKKKTKQLYELIKAEKKLSYVCDVKNGNIEYKEAYVNGEIVVNLYSINHIIENFKKIAEKYAKERVKEEDKYQYRHSDYRITDYNNLYYILLEFGYLRSCYRKKMDYWIRFCKEKNMEYGMELLLSISSNISKITEEQLSIIIELVYDNQTLDDFIVDYNCEQIYWISAGIPTMIDEKYVSLAKTLNPNLTDYIDMFGRKVEFKNR